jgi:site-specific recombinase XerD
VAVDIELRALKAAMNNAKRWQLVGANPYADGEQASLPEEQPVLFTKADMEALLKEISQKWLRELIVFAISAGMRQAETVNLCWKDVDLERRLIHLQSSPTFKTKHGKMRTIPMNEVVFERLAQKAKKSMAGYVFTRHNRKVGEGYLTHQFKKAVRQARLDERLHWHSLRHTHASWLFQAGASLYEVQRLLGHSSSRTTEVYSHLQSEQLRGTVTRSTVSINGLNIG